MEITLEDLLVLGAPPGLESSVDPTRRNGPFEDPPRRFVGRFRTHDRAPSSPPSRRRGRARVPPPVTTAVVGTCRHSLREANCETSPRSSSKRGDPRTRQPRVTGRRRSRALDRTVINRGDPDGNQSPVTSGGNLYRVGSDLERQMTDLAASRAGLSEMQCRSCPIRRGRWFFMSPDAKARLLATSGQDRDYTDNAAATDGPDPERPARTPIRTVVDPGTAAAEQRVVARFLIDRIAAAATVAARQDEAARPRAARLLRP